MQGNVLEATRRLENLATRLLAAGQEESGADGDCRSAPGIQHQYAVGRRT